MLQSCGHGGVGSRAGERPAWPKKRCKSNSRYRQGGLLQAGWLAARVVSSRRIFGRNDTAPERQPGGLRSPPKRRHRRSARSPGRQQQRHLEDLLDAGLDHGAVAELPPPTSFFMITAATRSLDTAACGWTARVPQAPPRRRADGEGDDGRVRSGGGPNGMDGSRGLPGGSSRWPSPTGSALLPWPTAPCPGWARDGTAATVRRPVW